MRTICSSRHSIKSILCISILLTILGCGVSEEQYNALQNENIGLRAKVDTLTNELNDLKYGPDALLKKATLKIDDKDYEAAKDVLTAIVDKYSTSTEALTAKKLLTAIIPKIEEAAFNNAQKDTGTSLLESYIQQYPDGRFLKTAQTLLEERNWQTALTNTSASGMQSFIDKYPNSNHLPEAKDLLIKYQVNEVFRNGNYSQLPPLTKNYSNYSDNYTDNSRFTIENTTGYLLTLLYSGPEQRRLTIGSNQTESIWLKKGSYKIVAYVDAPNVSNYAGEEQLNGEYSSSYYISTSSVPSSGNTYGNRYDYPGSSSGSYNWRSTETPTYRPRTDYPVYKTRSGAIYCDGSRSYATGRGACSHHGGVCEWLYE